MDVYVAAIGITISLIQPLQPENAGHDRISTWSVDRQHFASRLPAFEDRSGRESVPDFFLDAKHPQRRRIGSRPVAKAEL